MTGEGTTVYSGSPFPSSINWYTIQPAILAKFIAPVDGIYCMVNGSNYLNYPIYKMGDHSPVMAYNGTSHTYSGLANPYYVYNKVSIGTISDNYGWAIWSYTNSNDNNYVCQTIDDRYIFGGATCIAKNLPSSGKAYFYCKAGEPVVIFMSNDHPYSTSLACANLKITYQSR